MPQFYLSPHVYACQTDDGITFLNLRSNQYIGLGSTLAAKVTPLIEGLEPRTYILAGTANGEDQLTVENILAELQAADLIAKNRTPDHSAATPRLPRPIHSMIEDRQPERPKITFQLLIRACRAFVTISWLLKTRSLETVIRRQQNKKNRCEIGNNGPLIEQLAEAFWLIRPIFYTSREKCLFDSLVLAEFLSYFKQYPSLAIGITTAPFRAHCWIQIDSLVINDNTARVDRYTPILVV